MTAKVYTVENRKGGVGKTTTAVTLAVGLARRLHEDGGGNVLVIDMPEITGESGALRCSLGSMGRKMRKCSGWTTCVRM